MFGHETIGYNRQDGDLLDCGYNFEDLA